MDQEFPPSESPHAVKSAESEARGAKLAELVEIMRRLRDPVQGCAWDRVQDFRSISPYTIEEAYEVADAIDRMDMDDLKDELGDLQLQVVYHARMAEELGAFTIDDVMTSICAKMVRRHPHIFGDREESPGWEALKAEERAQDRNGSGDTSALAGVAHALPALKRAEKLQRRAARVGFDWPDASGPKAKIDEELAELNEAKNASERQSELGDLLFSVVNLARHLEIDPETALREASNRFEKRFRLVEDIADKSLKDLNIEELEALWKQAKKGISG
ncbi:nucleoside triphosphate pyrophosphohydrolase [Sphingosinicella rhizophila]|uniref:Nucleoside triphosphate pyrophosphohydrolase n=1 Tax=Sphingosinicella rhizophila TaxID=3050082 RepID=A0ABU3Q2M2_9SPHN|nr:nucleoside triphosphate pyrophosphohydrolase [Sphingosinicella sp. GR2756]MDT9597654.1 nucleoside triphosphate pyrophosphohydrolase [Sphingosinicella sp. GR2756]